MFFCAARGSAQTPSLGTTNLLEGPAAGTDSVVLAEAPSTRSWTATANDPWLHLDAANSAGAGSTNVVFTFDANPGLTRTGTITVGGMTLTTTQAGATYVPANPLTTLASSGLSYPAGVAVDGAGGLYIADDLAGVIDKWSARDGTITTVVSDLNSSAGVAVDVAGNVYIADYANNAILEWVADTGTLTTLVATGLNQPNSVAVDAAGNVYIADTGNNAIKEWLAATATVATLVSSGLNRPNGVALDAAGNVYIADTGNSAVKEWSAASGTVTTLVSSGLSEPNDVAVDGSGNVYIADSGNNAIKEWSATSGTVATLASSGLNYPWGLTVDGAGNVYIADSGNSAVEKLPRSFLDPTARTETAAAGGDSLPALLPPTQNLTGPLAPVSDQSWLSISGVANGVVSYSFAANLTTSRVANITVLGQSVAVTQSGSGFAYALGVAGLVEAAAAGSDSVGVAVSPPAGPWTAAANAGWLHVASESGAGSTNVVFTFDANPGPRRTGTLTIVDQTLTVTQYGSSMLGATILTEGMASGTDSVALNIWTQDGGWVATANDPWLHLDSADRQGNGNASVSFSFDANPGSGRTGTLTIAGQTLTVNQRGFAMLGATTILEGPAAGVDSVILATTPGTSWTAATNDAWLHLEAAGQGGTGSTNVVFGFDANPGATRSGTVTVAGQTLTVMQAGSTYVPANPFTRLISSGLSNPGGVAVDGAGGVYIADTSNFAIKKWTPATGTVATLTGSGLAYPTGVAVDGAGNVYIADPGNDAIKRWSAATGTVTTLFSSGLRSPWGVAVDAAGNVYIADSGNNAIKQWSRVTGAVTTLVSAGLSFPEGVAVDAAGNVYIADSGNNAIKEWTPASGTVATLVSSGLSFPETVAVDASGNVYVGDQANNAVKEWTAASGLVTTLVSPAQLSPSGLAVDGAGNVYVANNLSGTLSELPRAFVDPTPLSETAGGGGDVLPTVLPVTENLQPPFAPSSDQPWQTVTGVTNGVVSVAFASNPSASRTARLTVLGTAIPVTQAGSFTATLATNQLAEAAAAGSDSVVLTLSLPSGPWTATVNAPWLHLDAADQAGTGGASVTFTFDANPGPPRTGTLTIAGQTLAVTQFGNNTIGTSVRWEPPAAGADTVALSVLTESASWTATANDPWLHLDALNSQGVGNAIVIFTFDANPGPPRTGTLSIGQQTLTVTQGAFITVGTTNILEGPIAGSDSIVLAVTPSTRAWTATANDPWLHLDATNASGTGSTNVVFSFDPNAGATRTGTLTVAGQTVPVTQAGASYVAASPFTALISSGLNHPRGVAVDGAGNVYFTSGNKVKKWWAANGTVTKLVTSGLNTPEALAVDSAGNVYIADTGDNAIKKWTAASATVTTLVPIASVQTYFYQGVAVDGAGNVYFTSDSQIRKWTAADGSISTVASLGNPAAVAVDGAGNVYVADAGNLSIAKWTAATGTVSTLISAGLGFPASLAVDGAGNIYITDTGNAAIEKWTAADGLLTTLVGAGMSGVVGIAVDGAGSVYLADYDGGAIEELPRAFVDPTARTEAAAAGSDRLPVVLPATANLSGPFAPTSDQSWLTLDAIRDGVVSLGFPANPTASRTAHVGVLGQDIAVTQTSYPPAYSLGTTNLVEGPPGGIESVVLAVPPSPSPWIASANVPWLHLSLASQSGTGSTNLIFTFDTNTGGTRTGMVTVADQTLTVTQAGLNYVAANPLTRVVSSGLSNPQGVAVDAAGNVYIADTGNNAIKSWSPATGLSSVVVGSGLNQPQGVAVDAAGNVYIADTGNSAIKVWSGTNHTVTVLLDSGLDQPLGLALDAHGNLYVADSGNGRILELPSGTTAWTTLISGLWLPRGVAVDVAGNVYVVDAVFSGAMLLEWSPVSGVLSTLFQHTPGGELMLNPFGVAVDGCGNVYVADGNGFAIEKWTAATQTYTTLAGVTWPSGVAVDSAGNVQIAWGDSISELPRAFVNVKARDQTAAAGSAVLKTVLPASENLSGVFAPSSDQSWLTVTGAADGVVGYSFTANSSQAARSARLTVLGQSTTITQGGTESPTLGSPVWLSDGTFQFGFTGTAGASYSVLFTTNPALPLSAWTLAGPATEKAPGQFQFTTTPAAAAPNGFYCVHSP